MKAGERRRSDRPEAEREERAALPPSPARDVLALQRSAGNQAVSALLARQPTDTTQAAPARATLTKGGVIPLESFSQDTSRLDRTAPGQPAITCISKVAGHSAKLQTLLTGGDTFDAELELLKSGFKLNRTGAFVSSYSVASDSGIPYETWTIDTAPPRE